MSSRMELQAQEVIRKKATFLIPFLLLVFAISFIFEFLVFRVHFGSVNSPSLDRVIESG